MSTSAACTLAVLAVCIVSTVVLAQNCSNSCVHGSCHNNTCQCDSNWRGSNCNTFICDADNPCLNGGTCSRGNGSDFVCNCPPGYGGLLCDCNDGHTPIILCNSTNRCDNGGTCIVDPYSRNESCVCSSAYTGPDCSQLINLCHKVTCYNGGICRLTATDYTCDCPPGYQGSCEFPFPQYDICNTNPCQNGGECRNPVPIDIENGPYYYCVCPPGYTGQNCTVQLNYCDPNPCMNNGNCSELPDKTGYQCSCPPYHSGDQCQNYTDPCDSVTCQNGGQCLPQYTETDNGYEYSTTCNCTGGFTGERCQTDIDECSTNPCSNNGTCINQYGRYLCVCSVGFTGDDCSVNIDDCSSINPCHNGGSCVDGINSFTCNCSATPFTGNRCTVPRNSTCEYRGCNFGGSCEYDPLQGHRVCSCLTGWGGDFCLFKYQSCMVGPSGTACNTTGTSHCSSEDTCVCRPGYTGSLCDTLFIDPCHGNPCPSGATCTSANGGMDYQCLCPPGVTHVSCSNGSCPTCVNGGTCNIGQSICACPTGWGGVDCSYDLDECFNNPCLNGGTCENTAGSYSCGCPRDYAGRNCGTYNGSTCSDPGFCQNGGTCYNSSTASGIMTPVCNCTGGYEGVNCERRACPHSNCSHLANNGICDWHCFNEECNYDGRQGDCSLDNRTNPWAECSESICRTKYNDSVCNQECNNGPCLYDGNDCAPMPPACPAETVRQCSELVGNGRCDENCNTLQCSIDSADCNRQLYLHGTLIMILASPTNVRFEDRMDQFRIDLGRIVHAELEVLDYRTVTERDLSYYNVTPIRDTPYIYWKVTFRVNIQYCIQACPTTINQVVRSINAAYGTGTRRIDNFSIVSASEGPPPTNEGGGVDRTQIIAISVTVCVCVVIVVLALGVLGKRVRDNGGVGKTLKKIRVRGTWFTNSGGVVETDSSPNTRDPSLSERRSLSTDFMVEPYSSHQNSERRSDSSSWQPIQVPVSTNEDGGGATCVTAERLRDSRKWTHLHCEALRPLNEREVPLHVHDSSALDVQGPGGFTPLMIAVMAEDKDAMIRNKLVPVRSDSSSSSDQSERDILLNFKRPLTNGMGLGFLPHGRGHYPLASYSAVSAFINQRADVNIANDYGQTALHLAAKHGREDYVHQLLAAKADPNLQDIWGQTPLLVAIGAATDRAFKALLDCPKTSIELKSQGGVSPLMMCVKMANQSMLHQLMAKNVDIASTDNEGRTAVHWAAMINNIEALKLLIKHGPDNIKDSPNGRGETPLYLACREGSTECVRFLLFECYANSTLLDMLDRSPLQVAYERQHLDVVELLKQATQSAGPPPPPPLYSQKVSTANPLFGRVGSIKMEPGIHSMPPSYQQSVASSLPIAMSLPYSVPPPHPPPVGGGYPGLLATMAQGSSIPRVSSIEAELDQLLVSSLGPYSVPYTGTVAVSTAATQRLNADGDERSPGNSAANTEGVSPGLSIRHEFSPGSSSQSPPMYPTQTTPPVAAVHLSSAPSHQETQPLTHLPLPPQDYQQQSTTSSSTISSVDHQPSYNTALQSICHTNSPPVVGQMTSPDPSLPLAPAQRFSPRLPTSAATTTTENNSPLAGFHGFPSPPKEAGEYVHVPFHTQPSSADPQAVDIINSLTPSPEDYSSQQQNIENSPPQTQQGTILHGQYAYDYAFHGVHQPQFSFHHSQIPGLAVYSHESTV